MTTDATLTVEGNIAHLKLKSAALTARVLFPSGATFKVESAEQEPPQKPNKGVKRLMVRLPAQSGLVRVVVLLSPEWPDMGSAAGVVDVSPDARRCSSLAAVCSSPT